jgi:LruC domain-containing protein
LEIHLKEFSTGTNVFESDFSVSDYSGAVSVDAQNHAQGNPFITKQITRRGILTGNLPWVLDLPDNWKHPRENVDISIAYPNFFRWAEDNATFTDWYSSYVNQNKIYND